MTRTQYRLETDPSRVRKAFREWFEMLKAGSSTSSNHWRLAGTDVRFKPISRHEPRLHIEFWIGSSESVAVQINEPRVASRENGASHIANDSRGRRFLLRQGDIHGNEDLDRVKGAVFANRTGLAPASVLAKDSPARKQWHVVTALDGLRPASVRAATADFVLRCWNARIHGAQAAADQDHLQALLGNPERGGWYDIEPDPTPRRVLLIQGYVYEELEIILGRSKIELSKPRHAAGYEVDGVVTAPDGPALVEIKTGVSASNVYCGIGQLTVYPILLPDLRKLARILLLPGPPRPALVKAVESAGVELHAYEIILRGRKPPAIRFSQKFLRRCGVPADLASALGPAEQAD